jgi:hypothetical protein
MKYLYVISFKRDSTGKPASFGIVAETRTAAEAAARTLAGLGPDVEPQTSQTLHDVHYIVE